MRFCPDSVIYTDRVVDSLERMWSRASSWLRQLLIPLDPILYPRSSTDLEGLQVGGYGLTKS